MSQAVSSNLFSHTDISYRYSADNNVDRWLKTVRFSESVEALEAILDANTVDVNVQSNWGDTALHHAVEMNSYEKVKLLLERRANINIQSNRDAQL